MPKNKPIIPSMRLFVLACAYLPASIAFTVDHAKKVSTIAGIKKTPNINRIKPKNGNAMTLVGGVVGKVDVTVEVVAKITPKIRRPRTPVAAAMTQNIQPMKA